MKRILDSIPNTLLQEFLQYRISSTQLAAQTGYHPVALRRAIKRPPRPPRQKNKTALIQARNAFRASIAHLPIREIMERANVSLSTANRIKKAYHA